LEFLPGRAGHRNCARHNRQKSARDELRESLREKEVLLREGYVLKPFHERELQVTIELAMHRHALEQQQGK